MNVLLSNPLVGIILTLCVYFIAKWIRGKIDSPLANPILLSATMIIIVLTVTPLTIEQYYKGGDAMMLFILPATAAFSYQIYKQLEAFKQNVLPVIVGCIVGSITSALSVYFMCRLITVDRAVMISLMPKSATMAIAMELAEKNGGIAALAASAVIVTGITCTSLCSLLAKSLKLKDPVALGVAFGAAGHVMGAASAMEIGKTEGAIASISFLMTGVLTSVLFMVWPLSPV